MYDKRQQRIRHPQTFDLQKEGWIKNGKFENAYQFIQDNREDTEIYETLEKYGCVKVDKFTPEQEQSMYQDFTASSGDLRTRMDYVNTAEQLWNDLPLDVRKEFNYNKASFVENGEKWLKARIDKRANEEKAQQKAIQDAIKAEQKAQAELGVQKDVNE